MLNITKLVISIFLLKLAFVGLVAAPLISAFPAKAPSAKTSQAHELTDTPVVVNKTDNSTNLFDL